MLAPPDWRLFWRRLALLPLVVLLLLLLGVPLLSRLHRRSPAAVEGADVAPVWAVDLTGPSGSPWTIGAQVPSKPLAGQKRPPCEAPREREVSGGCWVATEHKPPCPRGLFERGSLCLMPVRADVVPTTIRP